MSKNKKIISIAVVALILLSSAYFFAPHKTSEKKLAPITTSQNIEEQSALPTTGENKNTEIKGEFAQATLEIDGSVYRGEVSKNTSVYDFMDKFRNNGKINFKDKTYLGMGKFIEEINGVRGDGARYWIYYVNGKKAKIGVSNYKISPGDVVSWKYEKEVY